MLTLRIAGAYAETLGQKIEISTGSTPELVEGTTAEGESHEG